jgi:1-acyl-sn-glycerol-3-phosphate acyltransferase
VSERSATGQSGSQFALLAESRFAPFFWTQFLGAFNSNVLKNALIVMVTYQAARFAGGRSAFAGMESGVLVNLAAGLFILPFFLFSATAGQIADKYEKSNLIRLVKVLEIAIMSIAAWGFVAGSLGVLLGVLFLSGLQSTLFGPIKYSILPQALKDAELVGGNALVESGTFIAILAGTITGGYLASLASAGPIAAALGGVTVALLGFAASWFIPKTPVGDARLAIDWNPIRETWRNFSEIKGNRTVFLSVLGISWFWLYGALFLSQFPDFAKTVLRGGESSVTALLAIFSVGVGLGSLLCEKLADRKIEIGLVPFGSIGMTLFGVDLYFSSGVLPEAPLGSVWLLFSEKAYLRVAGDLLLTGIFGGFYIVPLYALIQSRTPRSHVSRVVAGNNILNALFMAIGAVAAIAMIKLGFSVPEILLAAAAMNAVVAIYIYTLVPEFLMRFMVWMLIHSVYRLSKSGLERIPEEGPAILVCNHVSYVDALVISAACRRPVRWVMDHRIFRIPLLSFFFRTVRAIPIAPAKEDPEILARAYDAIAKALADGDLVGLFPEGRLTSDGEMGPFRAGIGQILERTPVPVIPMALSGLWQSLFARNRDKLRYATWLLWKRIALAIGEPVDTAKATTENLRAIVLGLRGDRK